MVDRPIKKADRVAGAEVAESGEREIQTQEIDQLGEQATEQAKEKSTASPHKAPPIRLKDSKERSENNSDSEEESDGRPNDRGDRSNGKGKQNDRSDDRNNDRSRSNDRGGDRNKRNSRSEEPSQPTNLALLRGPRPTKPKAEEPPVEVEEVELNSELPQENEVAIEVSESQE
jgi:hypothetical protein